MNNMNHPTKTPSWPVAVAAKAKWDDARRNTNATDKERKAACDAYRAAVFRCIRESGLG